MSSFDLSFVIGILLQMGAEASVDQAKRQEYVLRALKQVGLDPGTPPADFEGVYVYTLVEFGIDAPQQLLDLFRNHIIREAFRKSFETRDNSIVVNEIESFTEWNRLGSELRQLDLDPHVMLEAFARVFVRTADRSRGPADVRRDHLLQDLVTRFEDMARENQRVTILLEGLEKQQARSGSDDPRIFSSVPPVLPDYYAPRAPLLSDIFNQLRVPTPTEQFPEPASLVALTGLAGAGKTILAQALAAYDETRVSFPDGILWATLDSTLSGDTSADEVLSNWLLAIGVDPRLLISTQSKAAALRARLSSSRKLLIIDDAWDALSVRSILEGRGHNCGCLVVTRVRDMPAQLGITKVIRVDRLTENEAREIVERRIGHAISIVEWEKARLVLARLEWHALAISLAAAQIAVGDLSWDSLSNTLRVSTSMRAVDFAEPTARDDSLRLSFALSVQRLDAKLRRRFHWLGALARGASFYGEDVAMLWDGVIRLEQPDLNVVSDWRQEWANMRRTEAADALQELFRRGLLEITTPNATKPMHQQYQMHQLLQEYALELLKEGSDFDTAILHHMWVYTSITLTDTVGSLTESTYPFTKQQVLEVLERAWRSHTGESGLSIPNSELADVTIKTVPQALAQYWQGRGHWSELLLWAQRGLALGRAREDKEMQRTYLRILGETQGALGHSSQAVSFTQWALAISDELADRVGQCADLLRLGHLYLETQPDVAFNYYDRARVVMGGSSDRQTEGLLEGHLGNAHLMLGHFDEAISHLERALSIATEMQDIGAMGHRLGNLGNALLGRGKQQIEIAVRHFHESRDIARRQGDKLSEANRLMGLNQAYSGLAKPRLAEFCLRQGTNIYEEIHSPKAEQAKRALDSLIEHGPNELELLQPLEMLRLARDACQGDALASARLLPWLSFLESRPEVAVDMDLQLLTQRLRALLAGEREADVLVHGLPTNYAINVLLDLIDLAAPGKGEFVGIYCNVLSAMMLGETDASATGQALLRQLEAPPHIAYPDWQALATIMRSVMNKAPDIILGLQMLHDPLIAKVLHLVLEVVPLDKPA